MKQYTLFIAVSFFFIGCSSSNNTAPMTIVEDTIDGDKPESLEPSLVDRDWVLSSFIDIDGVNKIHMNDDEFSFTLRFVKSDNLDGSIRRSISGNVVCNGYSGEYTIDNTILSISNTETTTNECGRGSEAPSDLFNRLLVTNEDKTILSVQDSMLEVLSGSNEKLIFSEKSE